MYCITHYKPGSYEIWLNIFIVIELFIWIGHFTNLLPGSCIWVIGHFFSLCIVFWMVVMWPISRWLSELWPSMRPISVVLLNCDYVAISVVIWNVIMYGNFCSLLKCDYVAISVVFWNVIMYGNFYCLLKCDYVEISVVFWNVIMWKFL